VEAKAVKEPRVEKVAAIWAVSMADAAVAAAVVVAVRAAAVRAVLMVLAATAAAREDKAVVVAMVAAVQVAGSWVVVVAPAADRLGWPAAHTVAVGTWAATTVAAVMAEAAMAMARKVKVERVVARTADTRVRALLAVMVRTVMVGMMVGDLAPAVHPVVLSAPVLREERMAAVRSAVTVAAMVAALVMALWVAAKTVGAQMADKRGLAPMEGTMALVRSVGEAWVAVREAAAVASAVDWRVCPEDTAARAVLMAVATGAAAMAVGAVARACLEQARTAVGKLVVVTAVVERAGLTALAPWVATMVVAETVVAALVEGTAVAVADPVAERRVCLEDIAVRAVRLVVSMVEGRAVVLKGADTAVAIVAKVGMEVVARAEVMALELTVVVMEGVVTAVEEQAMAVESARACMVVATEAVAKEVAMAERPRPWGSCGMH
jgi:hypothetical protein